MTTADIAIIANTVVDLAAVAATWNLIRTGKIRLSAPTVPQMQAEQGQAEQGQAEQDTDQQPGDRKVAAP